MKQSSFRHGMKICCALYILLMLALLFGKGLYAFSERLESVRREGYFEVLANFINLQPFVSIGPFLQSLRYVPLHDMIFDLTAGNIFMLIPAGIFIPYFCESKRKLFPFLSCCCKMIIFIEVTQLLTLLGSCDIDDLILNMTGCLIGFVFFSICAFFRPRPRKTRCRAAA